MRRQLKDKIMLETGHCGRRGGVAVMACLAAVALAACDALPLGRTSRLVSIEPVPEMGMVCVMPRSGVRQESSQSAIRSDPGRRSLRMVRDTYPSLAAVSIDPQRNEVVFTDENLFQILVYDRRLDTPPGDAISEPRRAIHGPTTRIEFQAGVYRDPQNGEIYAVNNDTVDELVVFAADATGDVAPVRKLDTPHGTFGIGVDEKAREMFLTVQHDSSVVAYRKQAQGQEAPIRLLQGNRTRLADPHGVAVDSERRLIFVTNFGSTHDVRETESSRTRIPNWPLERDDAIPGSARFNRPSVNVYASTASGNVAPVRVIQGPKTGLNWPTAIAFHPGRNELFVANDTSHSVLVFDADADGDVAPRRVINGPRTEIKNPTGLALDVENNELWVANFGNHRATVYKLDASGDVPPLRRIRSAPDDEDALMIGNPGALGFDTRRGEMLVPNCVAHPQIAVFDRMAALNAKRSRAIEGQATLLGRTMHAIEYDALHDEIVVPQQFGQAVLTFAGGANGETPPLRYIQGPNTGLVRPSRLAIDPVNQEIYVPEDAGILVFPRMAHGDVKPLRVLRPDGWDASALAVDPVRNLLLVLASRTTGGGPPAVLVFNRTDAGLVKPTRVIAGDKTGLVSTRNIRVYPEKGWFAVVEVGQRSSAFESRAAFVGVWSVEAEGNVAPRFRIGGPNGELKQPRGVAFDPAHGNVLVSDKTLNAVLTYHYPEIY